MPITIDGAGTIAGLSAGGLPDGAITMPDLDSSVSSGVAKAWVNFNGTGTVAIRGSFNVSSITDGGTGNYTTNFTTAFANINYSAVFAISNNSSLGRIYTPQPVNISASACRVHCGTPTSGSSTDEQAADRAYVAAAFFG